MKLVDLDPQFIRSETRREMVTRVKKEIVADRPKGPWLPDEFEHREDDVEYRVHVDSLEEAHGLYFDCPKCQGTDGHKIVCWFENRVSDALQPGPGRWWPVGTGYTDLSFVPHTHSHSVALMGGCAAHFTLTGGEIFGA